MRWCSSLELRRRRSQASNCRLVRPQQRSAGDEDDRRRWPRRFRSRSLARQGWFAAPGLLIATLAGDYGFLSLAREPLSTSAIAESPAAIAPAALDAFLYTERGVYRSGETVYVAVRSSARRQGRGEIRLAADARRQAAGRRRVQTRQTLPDQGLGGRALTPYRWLPELRGREMVDRGFRRPQGRQLSAGWNSCSRITSPSGSISTLHPANRRSSPPQDHRSPFSLDARFLYGAPASPARRHRRHSAAGRPKARSLPVFTRAIVAGLADDDFNRHRDPVFRRHVQTDDKGHADLSVELPEGDEVTPPAASQDLIVRRRRIRADATVERTLVLPVRSKGVTVGDQERISTDDLDARAMSRCSRPSQLRRTATLHCTQRRGSWSLYQARRMTISGSTPMATGATSPFKSSKRTRRAATIDIGVDAPAKFSGTLCGWGAHRLDIKTA